VAKNNVVAQISGYITVDNTW